MYWGLMYIFLCHLFIYYLSASDHLPLLCSVILGLGSTDRISPGPVTAGQACQPRTLHWRTLPSGRERGGFPSSGVLFCYWVARGSACRGLGAVSSRVGQVSGLTAGAHALSTLQRSRSQLCRGPSSAFLSFLTTSSLSALGRAPALCSDCFRASFPSLSSQPPFPQLAVLYMNSSLFEFLRRSSD